MKDLLFTRYKTEILLFAVIAAYLCIWLFIFSSLDSFPVFGQDAGRYIILAENLLDKSAFTFDGATPEVFRTPGYPIILALSKWFGGGLVLASVFNIFFSAMLAVIIFSIARHLLSRRFAIAAAVIFSVSPQVVLHSVGIFGEIPFTFFFLLSVWLLFFKEKHGFKIFSIAGLSLGIAALIRPVALYFIPLFILFLIYEQRKKAVASLGWFIIGFLIIAGPWMIRNKIVGDSFSLSTIGAYNLAHYNAALYLESRFGVDAPETVSFRERLHEIPNDQGKLFSEKEALTNLAQEVIGQNKLSYLVFHLVESTKFFLSSGLRYVVLHIQIPEVQGFFGLNASSPDLLSLVRNFEVKKISETLLSQAFLTLDRIIMLLVTAFSFASIFFRRARFHTFVLLASASYLALLTGPVSIPRYRLPVEPFLIILALYTIGEILNTERFKNIFIFLLCLVRLPFAGTASSRPVSPKRVLIVQRAQVGDMVCTTPMFAAVKKFYPQAEVLLSGKKSNKPLMANHPYIDEYISFDRNFFETMRYLKNKKIDFAAIVNPDFHGLAAAYLAGITSIAVPVVVGGYTPYETIPYKILRKFVLTRAFAMGAYAPSERLRLLEPLGIVNADTAKVLGVGKESEKRVEEWRHKAGIKNNDFVVGMALAAGNKIKEWPVERFALVAKSLIGKYNAKIVVVGAPVDIPKSKEFLSLVNSRDVYDTAGLFSLEELKALITYLSLFISVDTGPLYIAEAFNVPTIDIIGPLDEREQPPIGEIHARVVAERVAPVIHIMNTRVVDWKEARRQTEAITVEMVTKVADELIHKLKLR